MNSAEKISKLVKKIGYSIQIFERKRIFWFFPYTVDLGHLSIISLGKYWRIEFSDNKLLLSGPIGVALNKADFCKKNGKIKVGSLQIEHLLLKNYTSPTWQVISKVEIERISNLIISKIDLAYHCNLGATG